MAMQGAYLSFFTQRINQSSLPRESSTLDPRRQASRLPIRDQESNIQSEKPS